MVGAATRALDEVQEQWARCSPVLELAVCIPFYESPGPTDAVRPNMDSRLVISSRLLCGLAVYICALRLLCTLYRTCTMCRDWPPWAFVLPYGIPTYHALVLHIGPFPFHLHISLSHYPSGRVCLVNLFGICRIRLSYCGYCCTMTVHEMEEVVEHQLTYGIRCPIFVSTYSVDSHFAIIERGWGYHMTFKALFGAQPVHEKVQLGSPLRLRLGSNFLLCASRLRIWSRVGSFVPFEWTSKQLYKR